MNSTSSAPATPEIGEREIRALARMLDRLDYYRLLKVEPSASLASIRDAYHRARCRFHPDSYLSRDVETRDAVDRIARRITEGYMVLRSREKRAAYDRTLANGNTRFTAEVEEEAKTIVNARQGLTANGRRFVVLADQEERVGNLKGAVLHLKMAVTFEPRNDALRDRLTRLQAKLDGRA
jgi:DnaJ-class molecular chaperone